MEGLEAEIAGPPWIYPWRLRDGRQLPLAVEELETLQRSVTGMIEPRVRAALEPTTTPRSALDLACCEGWFSHRLLDWGASRVVGIDVREHNIRRAKLLREHFGIPDERLELVQGDVFDIDPDALGTFDVVLVLGLIYHVEDPMGLLRLARRCTRGLCVIESQLTRQTAPIIHGNGRAAELHEAEGSLAIFIEAGWNPIASTGEVLSFVPNRTALAQMARAAGFEHVEYADPSGALNPQYVRGDRAALFAF
jgi:SAM-dependent methyltransferase